MIHRRLQQHVLLLNAAVDDADGWRVSARCYRCHREQRLRCGRAGSLRERDVFRFDDFEHIGVVEDDVLQSLPRDPDPGGEAVRQYANAPYLSPPSDIGDCKSMIYLNFWRPFHMVASIL